MLNRMAKAFIFAGGVTAGVALAGLPANAHEAWKKPHAAHGHYGKNFKHAGTYGDAQDSAVDRLNQQSLQAARSGTSDPALGAPAAPSAIPDTGTSTGVTK